MAWSCPVAEPTVRGALARNHDASGDRHGGLKFEFEFVFKFKLPVAFDTGRIAKVGFCRKPAFYLPGSRAPEMAL